MDLKTIIKKGNATDIAAMSEVQNWFRETTIPLEQQTLTWKITNKRLCEVWGALKERGIRNRYGNDPSEEISYQILTVRQWAALMKEKANNQ